MSTIHFFEDIILFIAPGISVVDGLEFQALRDFLACLSKCPVYAGVIACFEVFATLDHHEVTQLICLIVVEVKYFGDVIKLIAEGAIPVVCGLHRGLDKFEDLKWFTDCPK